MISLQSQPILERNNTQPDSAFKVPTPWAFRGELGFAAVIIAIVIVWAVWPLLSAPNNTYPVTVDGLGHLTRVDYLGDCLREWKWPSWFPYWYNGHTVLQYYPPLSFCIMAFIQIFSDNIMITFKVLVVLSQFVGALGVWYFCYRFIGAWIGILGGILYALQPYLLKSLLLTGALAQGPVFAITPWLLVFSVMFFEKRTSKRWVLVCLGSALLILSHAMHAYLVALCLGVFSLVLLIERKIAVQDFIIWGFAIALGGGLGAFWSVPGVTHLENPAVPFLLSEACAIYAATFEWFNPASRHTGQFYISISLLALAFTSIILIRKKSKNAHLILPFLTALAVSVCLSFGYYFPLFKFIPMNESLVTGRFLSFSALAATILCVYVFRGLITTYQSGFWPKKVGSVLCLVFVICIIGIDINPQLMSIQTNSYTELKGDIDLIPNHKEGFAQGRFTWVCPVNSDITYLPLLKKINMGDGWNIEGSPHNRAIWQHNIAIPNHCDDYVVKNLLYWNTRSTFISNQYSGLIKSLINNGFQILKTDSVKTILFNPSPSSYFIREERDAIAIGLAARGLNIYFPWLVEGKSVSLEDYDYEYLQRFKLIYLIEPDVKDFKQFQNMVSELAGEGKTVIVSMGRSKTWPLGDIIPYWENIGSGAVLVPTSGSPFTQGVTLDPDPYGQAPAMGNLDGVWMEMQVDKKRVPAIGYKNIGGNRVYFVGISMGQQLNSTHGVEIKALLEQIMDLGHPNKNFVPTAFPVAGAEWGYDGFNFNYKSERPVSMLVSVTYTPRWKGKLDNLPLKVQQMENLILLDLPAGEHQVSMNYGMTWVGWLGIALSIFSLLLVIFIYRRFGDLDRFFAFLSLQIRRVVEGLGA